MITPADHVCPRCMAEAALSATESWSDAALEMIRDLPYRFCDKHAAGDARALNLLLRDGKTVSCFRDYTEAEAFDTVLMPLYEGGVFSGVEWLGVQPRQAELEIAGRYLAARPKQRRGIAITRRLEP